MILNQRHLDMLVSQDEQRKMIEKIKSANKGDEIYHGVTCENHDVIETLFSRSGCRYYSAVAGYDCCYYKG